MGISLLKKDLKDNNNVVKDIKHIKSMNSYIFC